MNTLQIVFTVIAAVAGIAGVLGIAYAVFTSARVKQTIELYKAENEAQGKRIATLETEVEKLRDQNDALRDLATGRSAIDAFVTVFTRMMDQLNAKVDAIMKYMDKP